VKAVLTNLRRNRPESAPWPPSADALKCLLNELPDISQSDLLKPEEVLSALIVLQEFDKIFSKLEKGPNEEATNNAFNEVDSQLDLVREYFKSLEDTTPEDTISADSKAADEIKSKFMPVYSVLMADKVKPLQHRVLVESGRGTSLSIYYSSYSLIFFYLNAELFKFKSINFFS
jgi:hypothetical protein